MDHTRQPEQMARRESDEGQAHTISFDSYCMYVRLSSRREVKIALARMPRLLAATLAQRSQWVLVNEGQGIHWPALDLNITLTSLLQAIDLRPSTLGA